MGKGGGREGGRVCVWGERGVSKCGGEEEGAPAGSAQQQRRSPPLPHPLLTLVGPHLTVRLVGATDVDGVQGHNVPGASIDALSMLQGRVGGEE
jgi:hypothetical protein